MLTATILALSLGQGPPPVPGPPSVPQKEALMSGNIEYEEALTKSVKSGRSLIVFVNCQQHSIRNAWTTRVDSLYGDKGPKVLLVLPDGKTFFKLGVEWNRTDIEEAVTYREGQVSQRAIPFALSDRQSKSAQPDDSGPWLSRAESKRVEAIWPGVFPPNLKFYALAPRYQNLYTMNGGSFKGRDIDPLHDEHHPFLVSGGMESMSGWGSVKGLDVPEGKKIKVWEENTDVRAFALVPRYRWRFPEGTVAYDVLYTKNGIFEIRTQKRTKAGWSTEIVHKDADVVPVGYTGLRQSCSSCHDHAAEVVSVPGRIYLRSRWGDDGRFSWRPFDESGSLDYRWPIERN